MSSHMVTPMNDQPGGHDRDDDSVARTEAPVRVLVVDDDEVIRQLITLNLELEGFEVYEAVDGADALRMVAEVRPSVVTLDVMMPNLDGWDAAARLRSDPETADVKVVLLSARAQEADVRRGTGWVSTPT